MKENFVGMGNKELKRILSKYGIYLAFLMLCVFMVISTPTFLKIGNLTNILRQASIIGIVGVGMTFVIISSGIDLSVGSVMALSAVVTCSLATKTSTLPIFVAVLIGLGIGLLLGIITGFIIAYGRVAPFIVSLAMMTIARGVSLVYTGGRPVINLKDGYGFFGEGQISSIPVPIITFLLVVLLAVFLLDFSKFGRHVYAIGGNENAAKVSGINVKFTKLSVYALSGLFAGLAGIILSSRVDTGSPILGEGYEMNAISAVVIGGSSLAGGVGNMFGTVIGVLIISVMNNGLDILNVSSYYQQIIKGVIILLAVLIDRKNN